MGLSSYQKGQLQLVAFYAVAFILVGVILYFGWHYGRQINYSWSYKDLVQETICQTVKHEHLKNPKVCIK